MKVIRTSEMESDRVIQGDGFVSNRVVLQKDAMGYSMTKTVIQPGKRNYWHYKHHLETCYCVSGLGELVNATTGDKYKVTPDTTYILDNHEPHYFEAQTEVILVCVFNPPLVGSEIHREDGSYSPPKQSPVYNVRSVPMHKVTANDYNPNKVAPPEMELLETSIWEDGYTQPIVTFYDDEADIYIVVDGFHRYSTMINSERIREREQGMLPVVVIDKEIGDRMASTIRHNRARGTHNVELMSTMVAELVEMGKGDAWICKHIGMSPDELLRLKQITGVAALFANKDFSESWEVSDLESIAS
jgi:quercetin dioxygenase-like cupin family protein